MASDIAVGRLAVGKDGFLMKQAETLSEKELLQRVRLGSKEAYEIIVTRHMKAAYYIALGFLRNPQDAMDLSQDAFIRAFRKRKQFDHQRPFFPWFYRLLRNLCLDHLKKVKRRDEVPLDADILTEGKREDQEIKKAVWKGIETLPFEQKEAVILFYFRQMSYQEIAETTQKPIGTVMSTLYYAKKKLRSSVGKLIGFDERENGR